jgi:hypothetical protein
MRRFLIVLAVVFAGSAVVFGAGAALFFYSLTRLDPYPTFMTFMTDYQLRGSHSYGDVERRFSDFVGKAFPIGSDAKDAIRQITRGGFRVITAGSESVELLWNRRAGPCNEQYLIVIGLNVDGTIADINGRLQPFCL